MVHVRHGRQTVQLVGQTDAQPEQRRVLERYLLDGDFVEVRPGDCIHMNLSASGRGRGCGVNATNTDFIPRLWQRRRVMRATQLGALVCCYLNGLAESGPAFHNAHYYILIHGARSAKILPSNKNFATIGDV